jgi:hypothetical protein
MLRILCDRRQTRIVNIIVGYVTLCLLVYFGFDRLSVCLLTALEKNQKNHERR